MAKKTETETPIGGDQIIIGGETLDLTPELLVLKEKYDKMNKLQRGWFDAYLVNRDATLASKVAGYKGNPNTWSSTGAKNRAKFQDMIDTFDSFTKEMMSVVTELTEVYRFWGETVADTTHAMKDRLKASELMARAFGAFDHESGNMNVFINTEKYDAIPQETLEAFIIENTEHTND